MLRGIIGIAEAGTVVGVRRWLAKAIITGVCEEFFTNHDLHTLRDSNGIAEAGTVAGAMRGLAKAFLTGVCHEIMTNHDVAKRQGDRDRGL
jgi:hypothetical protein